MKIKNSNKILILILVLTITIPLMVAQVYLHKIKKGDFEYEKPTGKVEHPELNIQGSLVGIKAIKLVGGDYTDLLRSTVVHSDLNNYVISRQRASDSISVNPSGDTLIFKYCNTRQSRNIYIEDHVISVRLNLPDNLPIYADNCHVLFPSIDDHLKTTKLTASEFFLTHGAVLALGSQMLVFYNVPDTVIAGEKRKNVFIRDTTQVTEDSLNNIYGKIESAKIQANNSTIEISQPLIFDSLQLTMNNSATFKLTYPIKIKSLKANIDPKTNIVGSYKSVSSIGELVK